MNIWYNETFRILNSQADYSIQDLELYLNSANGKRIYNYVCIYLLYYIIYSMFVLLYTTTIIYYYIHMYCFLRYYNHYIYDKYKN